MLSSITVCPYVSLSNTKYESSHHLSAASVTPPTPDDLLTIPVDAYYDATSVGLGAFATALLSFWDVIHREHPKAFVVTENILPFSQYSPHACHTLGL